MSCTVFLKELLSWCYERSKDRRNPLKYRGFWGTSHNSPYRRSLINLLSSLPWLHWRQLKSLLCKIKRRKKFRTQLSKIADQKKSQAQRLRKQKRKLKQSVWQELEKMKKNNTKGSPKKRNIEVALRLHATVHLLFLNMFQSNSDNCPCLFNV